MLFEFCCFSSNGWTIMHQFRGGSRWATAPLPQTPQPNESAQKNHTVGWHHRVLKWPPAASWRLAARLSTGADLRLSGRLHTLRSRRRGDTREAVIKCQYVKRRGPEEAGLTCSGAEEGVRVKEATGFQSHVAGRTGKVFYDKVETILSSAPMNQKSESGHSDPDKVDLTHWFDSLICK